MRVSQRLDYVLRALTFLAQAETGDPVPAGEIAGALDLPRRFLEQQMHALTKRGLIECRRGAGGGCMLARPAADITVRDVVVAVEGAVIDVPHVRDSAVSEVWGEVQDALGRDLGRVTLADLAARQDRIDSAKVPMYYI